MRSVVLGAALVAFMTAPTLTHLASVGRLDTNDGRFSIWNVAWVAHAMLDPAAHVFDANIFAPHRGTLAYSELNLVAGVLGLPWYAATGDPLAAHNGAVFVALCLAFVLMSQLVRRLTGSEGAGLVAATAFTFCPYMSARTAHVQLLLIFVFPLVMIAFHHFAARPGPVRGALVGGALAIAALACGYYGIFAGCLLGLVALVAARGSWRYWGGLGVAAAVTAGLVLPVFMSYQQARLASGATPEVRPLSGAYAANLSAWLTSGAFAHEWWLPALAAWQPWKEVLFPGGVLVVLAAMGLQAARRDGRVRPLVVLYGLVAVVAFWASFGPDAGLYRVMHAVIPGMTMLRAPARLGILVVFALAVIAGVAVARLEVRWRALPAILVVLLVAELGVRTPEWGWPSWPLRERPPLDEAYVRLATLPRGTLLEFPFPYVSSDFHNHAQWMFWSAYHWQPLVNGYSDLIPPDFYDIALPINAFPSAESFALARARHVRYVLWHIDRYDEAGRAVLADRLGPFAPYLRPIVKTPDTWLYEIVGWPS